MEDELGIMLPVAALSVRYKQPAYYDEELTIRTNLSERPHRLICFTHEILNEAAQVINTAEVKLFFVDVNSNERVAPPDILLSKLEPYFT